jgi:hypothetical protein
MIGCGAHFQVPGLGHRVSDPGIQVQVLVPGQDPEPDYPHLAPEARDPKCFQPLTANRQPLTANRQPLTAYFTTFLHPSIVSFSNSLESILMP